MRMILPRTVRTLAIGFTLSVFILSAACSKGTPDTSRATPGSEATPTAASAGEAGDEGNVVITFASDEYQRALYEPLMEEFNRQNPGITVQFAALPQPEPGDSFEVTDWNRMIASAADTTLMYGTWAIASGGGAYFRDLGPLIDMDAAFEPDDFWSGALDACADKEGRILGLPFTLNLTGIYFDEAAFDAAGLPHPAPGWTWDDFSKSVAALAQQKGGKIRYGYAEQGYIYNSILAPVISAYLDDTGGEVDPEALEKDLKWYFDLAKSKAILPIRNMQDGQDIWQEWQDLFKGDARPAMWTGGLAEPVPGGAMVYSSDDPLSGMAISSHGFAPYPVSSDRAGARTSPANVTCGAVSAGSQHPRAAWTWLSFLSRQWLVRDRSMAWEFMQIPSRQSVAEQVDYWKNLPEKAVPAVKFALEHAWYGTLYMRSFDSISTALGEALSGSSTFAAAFQKAQAAVASAPEPTPDTTPIVVATPQAPPPADATVIKYFYDGANNPESRDFKDLVETFNKSHPDIFVKVERDFSGPPQDMNYLDFMAEKYDCFSWYTLNKEEKIDSLLSLNAFVEAEGPAFIQDFPAERLEDYRIEGKLVGLPSSSQPQVMAYNADLLAKRGLKAPSEDWTFDDFIQLASEAASTAAGDKSYGFMTSEWDNLLLIGRGIQMFETSGAAAKIDTPEMLNALIWLGDLVESGVLLVQKDDNWETINTAFTSGQLAFWVTQAGQSDWYFGPNEKPPYKTGVAPMPAVAETAIGINWAMTRGQFISANSQNPEACWTWIKFLSEQPNAFPGIPARLSVVNSPAWRAQVGEENAEMYLAALERVKPPPDQQNFDRTIWPTYNWRNQAVAAALKGEDPKQALVAAQRKADTYLACIAPVETAGLSDEEIQKEIMACARQADPEGQWQ